ncbi:voltage-dependent T-type calcium channel subunit alpha-1H-like [Megalobrama amblycephala]|uniref:voltage-dependent T-type calcium channel subunit alpha-1H-like n=1 Tax=Megalobrama amblycephala TaxID=75352 RepID=UPI002013E160|nr:voltage-dependent T-type calcium channel subunit alpha-1H-like [Megalobrama amblycephala]
MTVKVVALGFCSGNHSYMQSTWNVLDGVLVFVSLIDILVSLASTGGNRILCILLRTLRPLRVISRAPGLKLVVETLITSLRPTGNIVLICCAFFIVFGLLGVQLFKGKFYHCEGGDAKNITNMEECKDEGYKWIRRKYNFDNLGQALMSLFVLSCRDGWVNIMYDGLDAVGVNQQPVRNHNPWMLLYFISFLLIISLFVLNLFVGVLVENFHKCCQNQEEEEARMREEKRQKLLEKKRVSKENCGWNQLDLAIVLLSIMGITLEEIKITAALPINPTIIRIMRVGNLGLLFMLLFFIYAALGVEIFGKLAQSEMLQFGPHGHASLTELFLVYSTVILEEEPKLALLIFGACSCNELWNGLFIDSIDVQSFESKDNLERQAGITTGFKLHVPRIDGPSIPQASPLLPPHGQLPSVRTFQLSHSQHNIHSRPPSLASSSRSTSPSGSMFDSADPTGKEVRHIDSTARLWAGVQAEARSHSLSPYATSGTPLPMLMKNCSSAADLGELSIKDPKKCFSVDTKGFLEKPHSTDDHRRHSIEIYSSVDDGLFGQELSEKRHVPTRRQSLHIPRKKKMSPL